MKMPLSLYIGLRYTGARRKSRSVSFLSGVSILGLVVGVSLLVLVLSVMNGFDRELKQRILGLVPQAAIYHRDNIDNWQVLKVRLEQDPEIEAAAPFVQLNGLVSYRNEAASVLLYGFDIEAERHVSLIDQYLSDVVRTRLSAGEPIILLGKNVAEKLAVHKGEKVMLVVPNPVNKRAPKIAYFEVGDIIESKTELDSTLALTSLPNSARLTDQPMRVSGLRLKIKELFEAPNLMYQTTLNLGPGYYSSNWTRTHWNLYQAIQMSKNLVGLLMSMIVAIAAFNVVSTLVLVVVDKQGDIAILKTQGASNKQIMSIFIVQGLAIGVLGVAFGIGLGCLLSLGIQDFVAVVEGLFGIQFLQSDVYPLTYLPTEIRWSDVNTVAFTALGMSFFATLYPAWKASQVQPAVALRYE